MTSDVLIIGGGVIGLAAARELSRGGAGKITILERGSVGGEASAAAAGMLAPNAENDRADEFTRFCTESLSLYEDFAAELLAETGVDIELDQNGTLYAAFTEHDSAEIQKRFKWQQSAGLAVEYWAAEVVRKFEPFISPDVRSALYFPNDRQVDNRLLLAALEKSARLNGIEIRERTEVKSLIIENGKITGADANGEKFFAEKVLLTTGAWTSLIGTAGFKLPCIKPVRGQIIGFQTAKRLFQKVIYSPRGYLVPRADGRILIGATVEDAGFDQTATAAATGFLRTIAMEISPGLANLEITEIRVGLRPKAPDNLPVIGSFPQVENFFLATAHYRNGILLAPLTAKLLAKKIIENTDSEYFETFGLRRFQTANAG